MEKVGVSPVLKPGGKEPKKRDAVADEVAAANKRKAMKADKKRKKAKKKKAKVPPPPEQYPFPATHDEADEPPRRVPQMRTAKARDGGRTQSGGVRGIPADDIEDI